MRQARGRRPTCAVASLPEPPDATALAARWRRIDALAGRLYAALLPWVLIAGGALVGYLAALTRAAYLVEVSR